MNVDQIIYSDKPRVAKTERRMGPDPRFAEQFTLVVGDKTAPAYVVPVGMRYIRHKFFYDPVFNPDPYNVPGPAVSESIGNVRIDLEDEVVDPVLLDREKAIIVATQRFEALNPYAQAANLTPKVFVTRARFTAMHLSTLRTYHGEINTWEEVREEPAYFVEPYTPHHMGRIAQETGLAGQQTKLDQRLKTAKEAAYHSDQACWDLVDRYPLTDDFLTEQAVKKASQTRADVTAIVRDLPDKLKVQLHQAQIARVAYSFTLGMMERLPEIAFVNPNRLYEHEGLQIAGQEVNKLFSRLGRLPNFHDDDEFRDFVVATFTGWVGKTYGDKIIRGQLRKKGSTILTENSR